MQDGSYSTGQVAVELGVSQERIRALCQAKRVQAIHSPGGQWRIPEAELARLQKEGLPQLPHVVLTQAIHEADVAAETPPPRPEESPRVLQAIEETLVQRQRREALEQKVGILELERRKAETQDFFDARTREKAERYQLDREQARKEREEQLAQRQRAEWEAAAIRAIPAGAPAPIHERVRQEVRRQLCSLDPLPSRESVSRTIDAIVQTETAAWVRQQEIDKLLNGVREWLPWDARVRLGHDDPTWEKLARAVANQAILNAVPNVSLSELRAEVRRSVATVNERFDHVKRCADVARRVNLHGVAGATAEDKTASLRAVAEAITGLPHGTPTKQLEKVAQETLTPFVAAISARHKPMATSNSGQVADATQQRIIAVPTSNAPEARVSRLLTGIDRFVAEDVEAHFDISFASSAARKKFINRVEPQLRRKLIAEVVEHPTMADEALRQKIKTCLQNYSERGQF